MWASVSRACLSKMFIMHHSWWQPKWSISSWFHSSGDYSEPYRPNQCCLSTCAELSHSSCYFASLLSWRRLTVILGRSWNNAPNSRNLVMLKSLKWPLACLCVLRASLTFLLWVILLFMTWDLWSLWVSSRQWARGYWSWQSHQVCQKAQKAK